MKSDSINTHVSTLGFYGGVGMVTGANFLLNTGGINIMVDCGLVQGDRFAQKENGKKFPYDPSTVDVLIVTHAHADHIGRIPKLVRDGFKGVIYSTSPTKDLAAIMLQDAYKIMKMEQKRAGEPALFEEADVAHALTLWKGVPYKKRVDLADDVSFVLRDAGHILGASTIQLTRRGRSIAFSGDIGNVPQPLLEVPDIPNGYQYLVMESVYGNRVHEEVTERSDLLLSYIKETIKHNGTLIIPAFSLERTQGMLFEINNFIEEGIIPPIQTFLDSPLAIRVTDVYRQHIGYFKESVQKQIREGDDIFDFPKMSFTRSMSESREISSAKGPKIIIAGSGMSHGGRIRNHEKQYLGNTNTTLLLVGYQAVGSVGRLLQDGAKSIRIDNTKVSVKARVATIHGYSGHADRNGLIDFVAKGGGQIEKVFVTMGEERASLFLIQRLRDYLGINAVLPEEDSVVEINF